ncbi:hypothetical protein J6590_001186 [Homalodisca vitripennis]|nr:hypothetical protein J6590_001186 [Homalodisca vitripennis]
MENANYVTDAVVEAFLGKYFTFMFGLKGAQGLIDAESFFVTFKRSLLGMTNGLYTYKGLKESVHVPFNNTELDRLTVKLTSNALYVDDRKAVVTVLSHCELHNV